MAKGDARLADAAVVEQKVVEERVDERVGERVIAELEALRRANARREAEAKSRRKKILVVFLLVVLALVLLWNTGRMDPWLSEIGLNRNDCVKNGFGATFCGDDADAYQQNVGDLQTDLNALTSDAASSEVEAAQSNVRAAVPAMEAFYADNGTYTGADDPTNGIASIDPQSAALVIVVSAEPQTYCIESTVGSTTFSKNGPAADILPGPC
jgi:hypothetical protein